MRPLYSLMLFSLVLGCSGGDDSPPLPQPPGSLTLTWELPTTFEDGTPLGDTTLSAVMVYIAVPRERLEVLAGNRTFYIARELDKGTHCFVLTAVIGTLESDDSEIVCKTI